MKVVITKSNENRYDWTLINNNGTEASWSDKDYSDVRGAKRGAYRWLWRLCGELSNGSISVVVSE